MYWIDRSAFLLNGGTEKYPKQSARKSIKKMAENSQNEGTIFLSGSHLQNGYKESFNGKLRDELLNPRIN